LDFVVAEIARILAGISMVRNALESSWTAANKKTLGRRPASGQVLIGVPVNALKAAPLG
jgi:hypothetical protein